MADFAKSASAKTPLQLTGSDIHTSEAFVNALARGLDKVWKRDFEHPKQGMQFLGEESLKRETASYRTYRSIGGLVPQNRDADEIPYVTRGEGFGFTVSTYNYRQGIAIEKTLVEVDDVGVVRGLQSDMAQNADLTVEYAIADIFNRAVQPTNAPFLCDDGMYLIDGAGGTSYLRPNANPAAGGWSNEESSAAITPSSIYQAQLNARAMTGEDGYLAPTMIKKIICRPADEKTLWEIQKSDYRPTDAMNAKNYQFGKFEYVVYDYLTSASIFYLLGDPKSDQNELKFYWRVRPEFETWRDGSNPDITRQRVRFAFGLGCGSPRKMWRGGPVA